MDVHYNNEHIYVGDDIITSRDNVPPHRQRSHFKEESNTTSTQDCKSTVITKMNGKQRIVFSLMAVLFIITLAVSGVLAYCISRLNIQDIEQKDQQSANLKHIEELKNETRVSEEKLINLMNELDDAAKNETSSSEDKIIGRGCLMSLGPNMEGVAFNSSGSSDSRSKDIFAELDGQSTTTSTGSWCGRAGHNDSIEISFEAPLLVAGIVTQGSPSSDHWTMTYSILCLGEEGLYEEYSENGINKTFSGNSNRNTKVFNVFSETLSCRSIRIIPKTWHLEPCLRMDLVHEGCYAPARFEFEVISRGRWDGDSCSIKVNDVDKAPNSRGFCVVGFDPHSLTFKAASFDTYDDAAGQSSQMSSFLDSLPAYSVVAIAANDATAADENSTIHSNILSHLKELGAVGISCDLHYHGYRDSFSFIGQKSRTPDWTSCQLVRETKGYAVVHATIHTSRRFIVD